MSELPGPLAELLAGLIPRVASQAHGRFRNVPREDFEQEIWARVLEPRLRARLAELHAAGDCEAIIWIELKRAASALGRDDDRQRRAARAAAAGYAPEDEQFYATGVLRVLLTQYVDNGCQVADSPPQARDTGASSSGDGSSTGEYLVMMIDLDVSLKRLSAYQRNLLLRYFECPQDQNEDGRWARQQMASSMGLTYDALWKRVQRCLVALQRELGGASPWRRKG